MELGATTFPQDVARLVLRYRAKNSANKTCKAGHDLDHWSCPDKLMQNIRETLSTTTERFASPMDRSADLPAYWSAFKEDQLFGANHDAYSSPWTGSSQAYPGQDIKECDKAIRWAIASAEAHPQTPTCTIVVVPYTAGNPHLQHLQHAHTQALMHVDRAI